MKILHLTASPKGAASDSTKLGNEILKNILQEHPESTVRTIDLTKESIPHIEAIHMLSFATATEEKTPELLEAGKYSDKAIEELVEADIIVISSPVFNFGIPSVLKAWVDHIARAGVTFSFTANGPVGLVKNKKVYLALASGGIFSSGQWQAYDFASSYMHFLFSFIGVTDVTTFRVEGTNIPIIQDSAMPVAFKAVEEFVF